DYDSADYRIESLRKIIERNKNYFEEWPRWELIKIILLRFKRKSYNFSKLNKSDLTYIKKLGSKNRETSWSCGLQEIHPFHIWVASKIK
ncbi:MAG: hypothetical protein ACKOA1_11505, partial [Bacteroidota bacterium]